MNKHNGYKIFDMHTHVYPDAIAVKAVDALDQFYSFTSEGVGSLSDLERHSAKAGVDGFALLGVATNAHQVGHVNQALLRNAHNAALHGFKAVAFIGMHQDYDDMEGELERAKMLGAKGIKLHPDIQRVDLDDERLLKLYSLMEGSGLAVYLHMGDDRADYRYSTAERLKKVAGQFPRLRFIAAHFGAYMAWQDSPMLAGIDNIWYDTSSTLWALPADEANRLVRLFGVERLFFGTDYPVKTAETELDRFDQLDLSERERKAILWDNAARFLGI